MARIPDEIAKTIVFLYPSVSDGVGNSPAGGTGFLMEHEVENAPGYSVRYLVTNSHVAFNTGAFKLNRDDGGAMTYKVSEMPGKDWVHHPDGDDLAAVQVVIPSDEAVKVLPKTLIFTEEELQALHCGYGDQVFFFGRLVGHDGRESIQPILRFGTIALWPPTPVRQAKRAFDQESLLIEGVSVSGFSGSPVFLYVPPFSHRFSAGSFGPDLIGLSDETSLGFLGVNWGHLSVGTTEGESAGIMGVIPADRLQSLFDCEELRAQRDRLAEGRLPAA